MDLECFKSVCDILQLMHLLKIWNIYQVHFDFAVFEPYKDSKVDLLGPKLLFIALNLGGLALGVWKVRIHYTYTI